MTKKHRVAASDIEPGMKIAWFPDEWDEVGKVEVKSAIPLHNGRMRVVVDVEYVLYPQRYWLFDLED